jgi:hypothetical protein
MAGRSMRVIAARFRDRPRAEAVLRALRQRLGLLPGQAGAAVMSDGDAEPAGIFAGQFHEERLPEVEALIHDHEGEIVANVPRDHTELEGFGRSS